MKFQSISSSQQYGWLLKMGMMLFCLKQAMRWVYNLGVDTIIIFNHDPLQKKHCSSSSRNLSSENNSKNNFVRIFAQFFAQLFQQTFTKEKNMETLSCSNQLYTSVTATFIWRGGVNVNAWTQKKFLAFLLFILFVTRCLSLPVLLQVRTLWFVYIEGK